MRSRILSLTRLGFTRRQAEKIAEGDDVEALTDEEFLQFAHAWKNDRVDLMEPLVEKYGWEGLVDRLAEAVHTNNI